MRRNMLGTAGTLILSFALSMSMAGCAGKGDDGETAEPGTLDIQSVALHDSGGTGGDSEMETGSEENSEPDASDSQGAAPQSTELNNEVGNSADVGGNMESVYFEGADLNGRVLEFSDTGFTITPVHTVVYEDGTRNSWEAAPGKENEEDNIYVTYTENTIFEVVYFDMSLQEVSSREDADKSSIKKQTLVYVFGTGEDGKNWTADKVLIQRWKNS